MAGEQLSGVPESEYTELAAKRYKQSEERRLFRFKTCVSVLMKLPRFRISCTPHSRRSPMPPKGEFDSDDELEEDGMLAARGTALSSTSSSEDVEGSHIR